MVKISIVATHPIQYHIPWFIALSNRPDLQVKVYFGCQPDDLQQGVGFDQPFKWDIPMYDGYEWQELDKRNRSPRIAGFFSSNVRNTVDIFRRDRPDVMVLTGWQSLSGTYGKFPLVVSLEVVEHLYAPRILAQTMYDILEPSGLGILSTPYHGYFKNLALSVTSKWDRHLQPLRDGGHIKFFSIDTLTQLLEEGGFRDISILRAGRIPPLAKSMIALLRK